MKVVALMDMNKLKLAFGNLTFGTNSEGAWAFGKYLYKFIILADGTLIIGPLTDHRKLLALYDAWGSMTQDNVPCKSGWEEEFNQRYRVIGAGTVGCDGRVESWESSGFRVSTSDGRRDEIQKTITALLDDGTLKKSHRSQAGR